MVVPRIFVSYYAAEETNRDYQLAMQLINDLRVSGAEVVADGGGSVDDQFVNFIKQELPNCQWLILLQTPETLHSPRVQMTMNAALKLAAQQRIQGVLRIIGSPVDPQDIPPDWASLNTFYASQDYPRALEKLLLTLGLANSETRIQTGFAPPPPAPLSMHSSMHSMSSMYDRPPVRQARFSALDAIDFRSPRVIGLIAAALLVILGAVLTPWLISVFNRPTPPPPSKIVGSAYFTSSGLFNDIATKGTNDGIRIILSNLPAPANENSYYGWLLSDKRLTDGKSIYLGKLTLQGGQGTLTYMSAAHDSLLALGSRFLVTEENAFVPPANPSPDKNSWRFYGEIPQSQQQTAGTNNTVDHANVLDHLRQLLTSNDKLQKLHLQGGLNIWLLQNTQHVLNAAVDARGTGQPPNAVQIRRDLVQILDYLDGSQLVVKDIPPGIAPIAIDPQVAQVSLLTLDNEHQDPPGYIDHIGLHLQGIVGSPGVTKEQSSLAVQINSALNKVGDNLNRVHKDAFDLIHMTNDQLLDPAKSGAIFDDLVMQANEAYYGQYLARTGDRQGGVVWIFDHIQHLATLTVQRYP